MGDLLCVVLAEKRNEYNKTVSLGIEPHKNLYSQPHLDIFPGMDHFANVTKYQQLIFPIFHINRQITTYTDLVKFLKYS